MAKYSLPFEKIKRKILVKKEAETDDKLGFKPEERSTKEIINYGIVNINKPQGPTSHQVSDFVQKILDINKSGHSGTLDPHVHGVLPIALGRAAKLTGYFNNQDKEYVGIIYLHEDVEQEIIEKTIKKKFLGKIKQLPPVKSNVKREMREREIKSFNILEKQDKDVLFRVECEAGTYIRKLCYDIGEVLSVGAHMQELRRTRAGPFTEENGLATLHDLAYAQSHWQKTKDEVPLRGLIQPMEKR